MADADDRTDRSPTERLIDDLYARTRPTFIDHVLKSLDPCYTSRITPFPQDDIETADK